MIHIIIPAYNRVNYTINCLNSIKKQINYRDTSIILIDDGSKDNTTKIIKKKFPEVKILKGTGSLFWTGAVDLGIKYVMKSGKKNDWILLINNDVELSSNAITSLINLVKKKKRKAIAGALTLSFRDKKTIIKSGTVVNSWFWNSTNHLYQGKKIEEINLRPRNVNFLTGRCLMHPIEIFKKVGTYDVFNFRHYGADDEFSMRVKNYGYEVLLCPKSIVYLKDNKKTKKNKPNINFFINTLLGFKSNQNILNKLKLTKKIVPFYAKPTYFLIAIFKSIYVSILRYYEK